MDIYEAYNRQRSAYRDDDDPLQRHIANLSRLLGKALTSGLNSYIISMIETKDGRRALLDLRDIDKAKKEIADDMAETAKKSFIEAFDGLNATIKIK